MSMSVVIHYPLVMKMSMTSTFVLSDSSSTFQKLQQDIFKAFWQGFSRAFPTLREEHGSYHHVTLQHRNIQILNDEKLIQCLPECYSEEDGCYHLDVVFTKNRQISSKQDER